MRAVIQRVLNAKVDIDDKCVGEINGGLLVYLGVAKVDTDKDAQFIAEKLVNLRIFRDDAGKMNRSLLEIGGGILLISNFTLYGDCRKGRRPSFTSAAEPQLAESLYEKTGQLIAEQGVTVENGVFAAHMHISSTNDGPINFVLDSR